MGAREGGGLVSNSCPIIIRGRIEREHTRREIQGWRGGGSMNKGEQLNRTEYYFNSFFYIVSSTFDDLDFFQEG